MLVELTLAQARSLVRAGALVEAGEPDDWSKRDYRSLTNGLITLRSALDVAERDAAQRKRNTA